MAVHEASTRSVRSQIAYNLENVEIESRVFSRLTQDRIQQVAEDTQILSMDFGFQSTIATADHGTILSALESLRSRVDANSVTLVSLEYTVVADTLYPEAADIPFLFSELIEIGEEYGEASAIVPIDGKYYQMIVVPVLAPDPIAWLSIGFLVDELLVKELQKLVLSQISLLLLDSEGNWSIIASTLPPVLLEELLNIVSVAEWEAGKSVSFTMGEREYVLLVTPLQETNDFSIYAILQRSIEEVLQPYYRLRKTLIMLFAGGIFVFVLVTVLIARTVTKPVQTLVEGAREIKKGNYKHHVSIAQQDEMGELAHAFNDMVKGLDEKERIQNSLTEELNELIKELEHRNELSRAVISTRDLKEILEKVVRGVAESGGYDRVRLYLYDEQQNSLVCQTAFGMGKEKVQRLKLPLSGKHIGVSQLVFREKTSYVVEDAARDEKCDPELVKFLGVTSCAVVPLLAEEKAIGVMAVDCVRTQQPFPKERLNSLVAVANTAALAIENSLLYRDLEKRVQERTRQLEIANQRLKELDHLKSDFLSTVSHELRTPLTSVLGFARIISKRFHKTFLPNLDQTQKKVRRDVKRMEEEVEIIINEGERLTRLINDLLDLAKIESGKFDWKMKAVSLIEIVRSGVHATSSLSGDKGLEVKIVTHAEDFQVRGDQDKLIQVLTNLLSNSIKFTDEGSITCSLEQEEETITVKVTDTGMGIAPEDLGKVFEKFKQVGDTLTDRPKGTGLGLPICKEIIAQHGGKLWAESELGKGSTFIFALPALRKEAEKAQEIPLLSQVKQHVSEQLPKHVEDTPRILIVDDEKNIRTLLRRELEGVGYSVIEAQDGNEAIRLARAEKPDLITLDILMPGLDGFDVTTLLKQDEGTADIPIIILSIVEDEEKGYQLGVDSYLTKPIDAERLLTTVSSLVVRGKQQEVSPRKKILVIEENVGTVRAIEEILKLKPYQIITGNNGQEGIQKAREEHPDLIILSYDLYKAEDGEIVRALRTMDETCDSQIIVLTEPLKADMTTILEQIETDEQSHAKKTSG